LPTGLTQSTTFLETDKFISNKKSKSHVFPNPNQGIFAIDTGFLEENKNVMNIYDALGKTVYSTHNQSSKFDVSLPNLSSGLYFVKLQGNNYTETLKFIKE
jgi:Secretion system C-terminal sorting domain